MTKESKYLCICTTLAFPFFFDSDQKEKKTTVFIENGFLERGSRDLRALGLQSDLESSPSLSLTL